MRPFIMRLIKAVPAQQDGQDGFLMTYDADDLPEHIENPQWIPKANMEMLQAVSPDSAKEVIAAALAAG
jgi:hypothetical protein